MVVGRHFPYTSKNYGISTYKIRVRRVRRHMYCDFSTQELIKPLFDSSVSQSWYCNWGGRDVCDLLLLCLV